MRLRETVVVIAAATLLAGCGVSSSGLESMQSKASVSTTIPATTAPEASTTTEIPNTTSAPGTTAAPDTSEAPDTTSDAGSGDWPTSVENQFLSVCESGSNTAPVCECTLRAIEPQISVQQMLEAGSTGTLPSDIEDKVVKAAAECAQDSGSH